MSRQTRKAVALRRGDDRKRSTPVAATPVIEAFTYSLRRGSSVAGVLPAAPGTRVQRLDKDGTLIGEHAAVGFVLLRHPVSEERDELYVRPITPLGVVGRFALITGGER